MSKNLILKWIIQEINMETFKMNQFFHQGEKKFKVGDVPVTEQTYHIHGENWKHKDNHMPDQIC